MESQRVQKYLKIYGRVQGVYFRKFTQNSAEYLGITGWVKNLADGTVETLIQGNKKDISDMIQLLNKGPVAATVKKIEELPFENDADSDWLNSFKIIR